MTRVNSLSSDVSKPFAKLVGSNRLTVVAWRAEPPSAVRDLAVTYRDQSSVRLQWRPPDSDGGRTDVRYRVECVDCGGHVAYTPRQSNLHGTASVFTRHVTS